MAEPLCPEHDLRAAMSDAGEGRALIHVTQDDSDA